MFSYSSDFILFLLVNISLSHIIHIAHRTQWGHWLSCTEVVRESSGHNRVHVPWSPRIIKTSSKLRIAFKYYRFVTHVSRHAKGQQPLSKGWGNTINFGETTDWITKLQHLHIYVYLYTCIDCYQIELLTAMLVILKMMKNTQYVFVPRDICSHVDVCQSAYIDASTAVCTDMH